MEMSESIKEIATALSKAQSELKNITKDSKAEITTTKGYKFSYGYAQLSNVTEHVLPILSSNGLAVMQMPILGSDSTTQLVTMLMHTSGEWIKSSYPVRMQAQDPQSQGSAITYARRYALMAVVGIAGDDDDGEAASKGNNPEKKKEIVKQITTHQTSTTTIAMLKASLQAAYNGSQAKIDGISLSDYMMEEISTISPEPEQIEYLINLLKQNKAI